MDSAMLDLYTDYLISSTSYTTATGLSRVTDGAISHDKVTRFLSSKDFSQEDLWKVAKSLVREIEEEDSIIAIDDSIEEKPYTDENDIVAWHYDHSKGRSVKGMNFISGLYHASEASVPIGFNIVKKTEKYVNKKTKKQSRKSPVSKQEMYRNILTVAVKNNIQFKYVLNDIWFSSAENIRFVKNILGKDFVMPLKGNRKVALSEKELAAGSFVSIKNLKLGENVLVRLKGVDFPLRLVCQVFKNGDGSTGVLYLVSNNIELTKEQISAIYQKRWKIETYHQSLKNNASLAKSPTKTVRTQSNHLFASICAFIRLEKITISNTFNHFSLKGKIYIQAVKAAFRELQRIKNNSLQAVNRPADPA